MNGLTATNYAMSHDGDVVGIKRLNLPVNHRTGINEKSVITFKAYKTGFMFSGTIIFEVTSCVAIVCRKRTIRNDEKIVITIIVKFYRNSLVW